MTPFQVRTCRKVRQMKCNILAYSLFFTLNLLFQWGCGIAEDGASSLRGSMEHPKGPAPPGPTTADEALPLKLGIRVTHEKHQMLLEYRITNNGSRPIFIATGGLCSICTWAKVDGEWFTFPATEIILGGSLATWSLVGPTHSGEWCFDPRGGAMVDCVCGKVVIPREMANVSGEEECEVTISIRVAFVSNGDGELKRSYWDLRARSHCSCEKGDRRAVAETQGEGSRSCDFQGRRLALPKSR